MGLLITRVFLLTAPACGLLKVGQVPADPREGHFRLLDDGLLLTRPLKDKAHTSRTPHAGT